MTDSSRGLILRAHVSGLEGNARNPRGLSTGELGDGGGDPFCFLFPEEISGSQERAVDIPAPPSQKVPLWWPHGIYRQNPTRGTQGCWDETGPWLLHLLGEDKPLFPAVWAPVTPWGCGAPLSRPAHRRVSSQAPGSEQFHQMAPPSEGSLGEPPGALWVPAHPFPTMLRQDEVSQVPRPHEPHPKSGDTSPPIGHIYFPDRELQGCAPNRPTQRAPWGASVLWSQGPSSTGGWVGEPPR